MSLCIVYITLQSWNKFGCFTTAFLHNGGKEKKYCVFKLQVMFRKVSSFYVCSICLWNLLFKLKSMKKNGKQKAGFRWKCVLKSMFILLFTKKTMNSRLSLAKYQFTWRHMWNLLYKVGRVFVLKWFKVHNVECYEKSTPVMRLCNYRLINAIVFLIKILVECKYV